MSVVDATGCGAHKSVSDEHAVIYRAKHYIMCCFFWKIILYNVFFFKGHHLISHIYLTLIFNINKYVFPNICTIPFFAFRGFFL